MAPVMDNQVTALRNAKRDRDMLCVFILQLQNVRITSVACAINPCICIYMPPAQQCVGRSYAIPELRREQAFRSVLGNCMLISCIYFGHQSRSLVNVPLFRSTHLGQVSFPQISNERTYLSMNVRSLGRNTCQNSAHVPEFISVLCLPRNEITFGWEAHILVVVEGRLFL